MNVTRGQTALVLRVINIVTLTDRQVIQFIAVAHVLKMYRSSEIE